MAAEAIAGDALGELQLVRLAVELGALDCGGPPSTDERQLVQRALATTVQPLVAPTDVVSAVRAGLDPLGDALCRLRPAAERRALGAFYTPPRLVEAMVTWVLAQRPDRVVDPGCGSGRFAAAVIRRQPDLHVLAVDVDPLATLVTRATLAMLGAKAAEVQQADYTTLALPPAGGRTAFVGNPPYVRHHDLSPQTKAWAQAAAARLGHRISGLAGLHALFYLATALHARAGDIGCFVTSAEWLDVGYGDVVRQLLLNSLGAESLHLIDPTAMTFEGAQTTALITCFVSGSEPAGLRLRRLSSIDKLGDLGRGETLPREQWEAAKRWTSLLAAQPPSDPVVGRGQVPLSSLVAVHRGLVTGANDFFVLSRERARALGVEQWCIPAITDAREILDSGGVVRDAPERQLLFRVPKEIDRQAYPALDRYLRQGEVPRAGRAPVAQTYVGSHRQPWWYLGKQVPAPIVASYMARRPPAFALNPDGLALINIGHGLYPHKAMPPEQLERLCAALNAASASFVGSGRTYQGGLEKFEPREMEALLIRMDQ